MTSSRSDSPRAPPAAHRLDDRSVAATPTSAEISASSSASTVSTSTGRLRCAGSSARADDLVEPLDELLLGAGERLLDLVEKTHSRSVTMIRFGPLPPAASAPRRASRGERPALEDGRHLRRRCGSSMPWRAPSASAAPVVRTPSATMRMPARISRQRPAAAELDADVAVAAQIAGAGQHEIAEPAQAGERLAPAAFGARRAATSRPGRA